MTNAHVVTDRLASRRHVRAPMAVAGAVVLGLSLLLSVGPALVAAKNSSSNGSNGSSSTSGTHGTSGNVKVHDSATGVETSGTDNEPHVCSFWLEFTFEAPFEAGTWLVVSWAPTGDGTTVASGTYDTTGDGVDASSTIELSAGHYRVEWAATSATSNKKKTFWVDACDQSPVEEPLAEELPPRDAPSSPADESPVEDVPPTDAPSSPAEESPVDELVLGGEETAPEDVQSQAEEVPPTDEEAPPSDDEDTNPVEEPVTEDPTSPEDASNVEDASSPDDASDVEEPARVEDGGSTDPGTPPAQDQLGSVGTSDESTMPDTATPVAPVQSGALAALGLLMAVLVHTIVRRDRLTDREIAD